MKEIEPIITEEVWNDGRIKVVKRSLWGVINASSWTEYRIIEGEWAFIQTHFTEPTFIMRDKKINQLLNGM